MIARRGGCAGCGALHSDGGGGLLLLLLLLLIALSDCCGRQGLRIDHAGDAVVRLVQLLCLHVLRGTSRIRTRMILAVVVAAAVVVRLV